MDLVICITKEQEHNTGKDDSTDPVKRLRGLMYSLIKIAFFSEFCVFCFCFRTVGVNFLSDVSVIFFSIECMGIHSAGLP